MTTRPRIYSFTQESNDGYAIALHGGAGTLDENALDDERLAHFHQTLRHCLAQGERILANGGSALDAVEATVKALELAEEFNAGHGACMTWNGEHELDAAIMDGATRQSGAVASVRTTKSPIAAARAVLDHSDHLLLSGQGADDFARIAGLESVDNSYFTTPMRLQHWQDLHTEREDAERDLFRFGTVGAVARDRHGNLAAATSTGGITNKRWGRIGDSPLVGSGTYADNRSCAISCTGHGELFIRAVAAHDISSRMRYLGERLDTACTTLLANDLNVPNGAGGMIGVDAQGNLTLAFNSRGMYRAWSSECGAAGSAIGEGVVEWMPMKAEG